MGIFRAVVQETDEGQHFGLFHIGDDLGCDLRSDLLRDLDVVDVGHIGVLFLPDVLHGNCTSRTHGPPGTVLQTCLGPNAAIDA
jgi:hypothetical protein